MRRKGVFSGKNPREENPHEENPQEGSPPKHSDEEPPPEIYFKYYLKNPIVLSVASREHRLPITSNNFNDVSWDCRSHFAYAGP
jgi:hypothetical protein